MTPKEIRGLIAFHTGGLQQYGEFMGPAAQYLEQQTVRALEELLAKVKGDQTDG